MCCGNSSQFKYWVAQLLFALQLYISILYSGEVNQVNFENGYAQGHPKPRR